MEELIRIQTTKGGRKVVSARDLYNFLEVKTDFKDWMPRMLAYGFEEGKDFSSFLSESTGGRPTKEFVITLDTAKEISMIQRTEKGKQARQYFIACEKRLKEIAQPSIPQSYAEALQLAANQARQIERQAIQIEADKPKVLFADSVSVSSNTILIGELAKILKQNGVEIGQNRLFEWMRENGYLIRRNATDHNMPTQLAMNLGLFEIKETAIAHSNGQVGIGKTTKVTGKGQQYFIHKFLSAQ